MPADGGQEQGEIVLCLANCRTLIKLLALRLITEWLWDAESAIHCEGMAQGSYQVGVGGTESVQQADCQRLGHERQAHTLCDLHNHTSSSFHRAGSDPAIISSLTDPQADLVFQDGLHGLQ